MNFVGVDIGASQTRIISQNCRIGVLPNNALQLGMDDKVKIVPYDNKLENSLEIIIKKEGQSERFPVHMLYGSMAERQSHLNIRPSVQQHKHMQSLSYTSMAMAVAVSIIEFETPEDVTLYVAVPPAEIEKAEVAFRSELVGRFEVTLPKYQGGVTKTFRIQDVRCVEESVMSIVSYLFNMDGSMTPEGMKMLKGNMLGINIGASTTDLAIVKNGRYLEKSGKTIPVGGNLARDFLISEVNDRYGFEMPLEDANVAMQEGRMQLGARYEDIGEIVSHAKDALARDIVARMDTYFKSIDIPIQMLRGITVSGGGSLRSFYEEDGKKVYTSDPMSKFVTDRLKGWCDAVEVISYGDEARLADIKGVYIRAMVDASKENANRTVKKEDDGFRI